MKLRRIVLFVDDLDKAILFYKATLQLPVNEERKGWIEFDTGATPIALHQGKGRKPRFEYIVGDLTTAEREAQKQGWKCSRKEGIDGSDYLEGKDKGGNTIRLLVERD